ncbi:MAG: SAM-dependent methyltransferase [Defluviitaleaceae bacterium]|nr:SAM-dependent methyltransferase [Defluviitaleaceae bacterium]
MGIPIEMLGQDIYKIVLSKPVKSSQYTRAEIVKNGDSYQLSNYTQKQVFHKNFTTQELKPALDGLFGVEFTQYHAWDGEYEYVAKVSKKGKVLTSRKKSQSQPTRTGFAQGSFNRQKNYIIAEGDGIPALVDMGVFTKDGKVSAQMRDKFGQINRFLELIADEVRDIPEGTTVNIIDFGCGKSYLTFLVYHYFSKIRGLGVSICGMDLDPHVVKTCTAAVEKYGYPSLKFMQGDIGSQSTPPVEGWGSANTFNIMISLHACDTATDHALYNAVKWNADLICAAPCCQHELKKQMNPQSLHLLNRHGIIKERIAALATDAIRSNLLECCGYKTQIIEFIDTEHTPKNLLIRGKKRIGKGPGAAWGEVEAVVREFGFEPTLLRLLRDGGVI